LTAVAVHSVARDIKMPLTLHFTFRPHWQRTCRRYMHIYTTNIYNTICGTNTQRCCKRLELNNPPFLALSTLRRRNIKTQFYFYGQAYSPHYSVTKRSFSKTMMSPYKREFSQTQWIQNDRWLLRSQIFMCCVERKH